MTPAPSTRIACLVTALLFAFSPLSALAQAQTAKLSASGDHVVSSAALHRAVVASAETQQANIAKVQQFLSTSRARLAMKRAGLDYRVVRRGVPLLSPRELAELAARSDKAQKQFRAGALTNQQLTYIIIALATAVVIIVILKA